MSRNIDADDCKELMYVKCSGQDSRFVEAMTEVIDNTPTVELEKVKHGEWLGNEDDFWIICSACKYEIYDDLDERKSKYCPHCGAKMDGGSEQND